MNDDWKIRFRKEYLGDLVDDYGEKHLYDEIVDFIQQEKEKSFEEGKREGAEKVFNNLSIEEALRWSDKHRLLSNSEGVRIVHIKQLLKLIVDTKE